MQTSEVWNHSVFEKFIDKILVNENEKVFPISDLQIVPLLLRWLTLTKIVDLMYMPMFWVLQKIFDKVNNKLFDVLITKGICALECRFLIFRYSNQLYRVRWRDCISTRLNVSNGLKQGGAMSPFLFGIYIYIDQLLNAPQYFFVGWDSIGNIFVGAFAYAADIVILTPAKTALHTM